MSATDDRATDDELLSKINEAVAVVNATEAEHVSRSRALGLLLLEAKKLHPATKDFKKFLKPVAGLGLSRAYELMRLAGGRTTENELRKEARERQAKSRAKKKLPPQLPPPPQAQPAPEAQPAADFRDVTERAPNADASAKKSAKALAEFTVACRTYWPGITEESDLVKARAFIDQLMTPRAKAA